MDESGHSGDAGAADSGDGADSREHTRLNGWATPDSPWSNAGAALESEEDVPAWRRPTSSEARPIPRSLERSFGSGAIPAQSLPVYPGSPAPVPAPVPPGFIDAKQSGEIPPSGEPRSGQFRSGEPRSDKFRPGEPWSDQFRPGEPRSSEFRSGESRSSEFRSGEFRSGEFRSGEPRPGELRPPEDEAARWGENRSRYADLLAPLAPERPELPRTTRPESGLSTGGLNPGGLNGSGSFGSPAAPINHPAPLRGFDVPTPNSAPPFPYEGDLDDVPRAPAPPVTPQRTTAAVPLVRPAAPGARRADWIATDLGQESARHALSQGTPLQGSPTLGSGGPAVGSAGVGAPGVSGPGVSGPGVSGPGVSGPGVSSPGVSSPGVSSPGVSSPGVGGSGFGGSGFGSSGIGSPAAVGPGSGSGNGSGTAPGIGSSSAAIPGSGPGAGGSGAGGSGAGGSGAGGSGAGGPGAGGSGIGGPGIGSSGIGGSGAGGFGLSGPGIGGQGIGSPVAPVHGSPVPAPLPRTELPAGTQADKPVAGETHAVRSSYDPSSFPRRLGYEPTPAAESSGYTPPPAYSGFGGRGADPGRPGDPGGPRSAVPGDQGTRVLLPQRVPAQPDVPKVPEPPLVEPTAETPALARIATHLRRGDVLPAQDRQEGFDVQAILAAVREVAGVRDASLRTTPAGAHSLRLDLAEGADPAEVSRRVARLLQDRMGLDAAMKGEAPPAPVSPARPAPESVSRQFLQAAPPVSAPPGRLDPARPDPARPEFVRSESGGQEQGRPEPRRPDFVRSELAGQEQASPEPRRPEFVRSDLGGPEQGRPESGRQELGRPELGRQDLGRPELGRPELGRPELGRPESGRQELGSPEAARPTTKRPEPLRSEPDRAEKPAQHERADDTVPAEQVIEAAVVSTGVEARAPRPLYPSHDPGPRIVIENVQVNTFGTDATVEVRLGVGGRSAAGEASGPAVDGYLLRLCALATAAAVDQLLAGSDHPDGPVRCFVEHAAAVPFGASQVAVAVLLLSCNGWVEQLAGSAVVAGDDRLAMVRATLAAVNRRLEALLTG